MEYYCDICYKTIKLKSKIKHNRSKNHLNMDNCVRKVYLIGDIYWEDFEEILY